MAFVILNNGLNPRRPYRGSDGPISKGEKIALVSIVTALVAIAVFCTVMAVRWNNYTTAKRAEWDMGQGRPVAVKLVRDPAREVTVELPGTIGNPIDWWNECGSKYCKSWNIKHYPAVYEVGTLRQAEAGCFVGQPDNPVGSLMITSTRPGAYKFTYAHDGKRFTVCSIGPRQDGDHIVIWSDDPSAQR